MVLNRYFKIAIPFQFSFIVVEIFKKMSAKKIYTWQNTKNEKVIVINVVLYIKYKLNNKRILVQNFLLHSIFVNFNENR